MARGLVARRFRRYRSSPVAAVTGAIFVACVDVTANLFAQGAA